jgi:hypothetical protein
MPLLDLFWALMMFAVFALGVWLLFVVLMDIFARPDLSGGARVAWTVGAIVLPVVGSLIYLATRGPDAGELRTGLGAAHSRADIYR